MLFNSPEFIGLLILTLLLYYLPLFRKLQIVILIVASLFFYSYTQPWLVLLLLFSVTINIVTSYFVVYGPTQRQKLTAAIGVILNLLILIFFKYSALLASTFLNTSGDIAEFLVTLPLPIGISFFTFQGISLVVDVYRQKNTTGSALVPSSLLKHAKQILFFKAFFPQLISGPIVKAYDFIPQITQKFWSDVKWGVVFRYLLTGYFLKMVVADNLKDFTFWIAYPHFQSYSSLTLFFMLFGYSCQIFADFAGYSLIAIGLALLFGYTFPPNFNFPYISTSFREFWKRWHISLSSFLMEYLYIPLGGSKKGRVRTYVNLMLVMLLGGLWHGAAWSYALWGGVHGIALALERLLSDSIQVVENRLLLFLKGILVFCFVTMAWLLFKLPDFNHVIAFIEAIFANHHMANNRQLIIYILLYSAPVLLYHFIYLLKRHSSLLLIWLPKMEYLAYGTMLFLIAVNSGAPGAFIYFQF